jgi:hypothetical protein
LRRKKVSLSSVIILYLVGWLGRLWGLTGSVLTQVMCTVAPTVLGFSGAVQLLKWMLGTAMGEKLGHHQAGGREGVCHGSA